MANRYARNSAILAKIETTYGTDASPTGGSNAILVSNIQPTPLDAQNVDRALIRAYFGGSEQLVGTSHVKLGFDVEIAGSGTAGTAPAWGPLLRACGFAETITASTRVDYIPISTAFESATIYYYDDGVLYSLLGARGSFKVGMGLGDIPKLSFEFVGLRAAPTATSLPSATLTGFTKPVVVNDTNTADITLGCTYSAGALSGGTTYPSRGFSLDVGHAVNHTPLLGGETIDITDRNVTGSFELDLTAAQEVSFMSSIVANTTQSFGIVHGTTAGNIVGFHAPVMQLINPKKTELNGKRLQSYDARFMPSTGNDDLRIFVK